MGSPVDYDTHYRAGRGVCGEPFDEVVRFMERQYRPGARLLDLGCGQGRDSLVAARIGYSVVGVDLSTVGLEQLAHDAKRERLSIEVHEHDVTTFRSRKRFDFVLFDRVLHLLMTDDERREALVNAQRLARKHAAIAVADGPKHSPLIRSFFDAHPTWTIVKRNSRFLFATR